MSDPTPNDPTMNPPSANVPTDPAQHTPPAPKRKKKRWWLRIVFALLLLIILLIACAPYLAGTGPVRSIVVSKVNDNLNGSISIDDYSVGWTGGISASGIKVFDAQKNLMLEIPRVVTHLSLIGAMRGNLDLGDTQADVTLTDVRVAKDGTVNLAELANKNAPAEPKVHHEKKPGARAAQPIELPNVRGKITLNILGGKISGEGVPTTVNVAPSTVVLNIPDINQPIQDDIKLAYQVGSAKPSTITLAGTIDAVKNGKVDVDTIKDTVKADQTLTLDNVDLGAAAPFVQPSLGPDGQLAGIASGKVAMKVNGIAGISADGRLQVSDVVFAGAGVKDVLKLSIIDVPINVTRTVKDANTTVIDIKTQVVSKLADGSEFFDVDIAGQLQEQSLLNLADKKAPGAEGTLLITATLPKLDAVARALPKTLALDESVKVTSGSFTEISNIKISADRVTIEPKLDLFVNGTRGGQPIAVKPVHLEAAVSAFPNGNAVPSLRDLKLGLTSSFATINGGGETLAKVNAKGDFDLAKLRDEAAQFSNLGEMQLAGTGDFNVTTAGDPTVGSAPVAVNANVNLNNIIASGVGPATKDKPLNISRAALVASANLAMKDGSPTSVDNGSLTFQTGEANAPLINVAATGNYNIASKAATFELSKFSIDKLEQVQQQYGALVPALKDLQIQSGAVYAQVAGTWDGKTLTLTKPLGLSMPNIAIRKGDRQIINREDITATINAIVTTGAQTNVKLSELSLAAKSGLFSVNKSGDKPIDVTLAGNGIKGNGAIALAADLKRLSDIAQSFGGDVVVKNQSGQIQSGAFNGTLALAHGEKPQTDITFDGTIANLSVTTGAKPIQNESVAIKLNASSPDDFSAVNVASAGIESRFANAKVNGAVIKLGGGPLDMVQSADIEAHVPDLAAVKSLLDAFSPPVASAPQARASNDAQPIYLTEQDAPPKKKKRAPAKREDASEVASAPAALEPLQVTSGSADLKLNVSRDSANAMVVKLTETKLSKIGIARGPRQYAFPSDINFALSANVASNNGAISSATVSELVGDLGGIAKLSMPEPIKVTGSMDQPNVAGTIKLDGTLDAAVPLLAVLQGADELPYRGDFSTTQKVSSAQDAVNLDGTFSSSRFAMLGADGKVAFEDSIDEKNSVGLYMKTKTATIRSLTLNLPKSNAIGLSATGRVIGWDQNRAIKDAKLDLTYDLATLWKIAFPMLSPEQREQYKEMKVAGKATRTFNVSGAFPNKPTVYESMKYLSADGGFAIELCDLPQGLTAQIIDVPFKVTKGVFVIEPGKIGPRPPTPEDSTDAKANGSGLFGDGRSSGSGGEKSSRRKATDEPAAPKTRGTQAPAPADLKPENGYANTGALNLAGITVDLTTPDLIVNIPKNKPILQNVRLNPVLADSLGKIGAALFVGSSTAEGLINVRVAECRNVPIGDLTARDRHANATIVLNVENLKLAGSLTSLLAQFLGTDAITGSVPDSTVTIANGFATTDLTVLIDKEVEDAKTGKNHLQGQPITTKGGVNLATLDFKDFVLTISPELLLRDWRKVLPNGLQIPLEGKANKPKIDEKKLTELTVKNAIPGLLGGGNKDNAKDGGKNDDPIGGILDKLGGKKDKKKGGGK